MSIQDEVAKIPKDYLTDLVIVIEVEPINLHRQATQYALEKPAL